MSRVSTAVRAGATQLRRTPLLVGLIVAGPAYVVTVFSWVAPSAPATVYVGEPVRTTLSAAFPALTTPMTAALLSGVAGLFLTGTVARPDGRLVLAGYRPREVVLARLGLLAGVSLVATTVSTAAMLVAFRPAHLAWFALGTALTALVYGLVGLVLGLVLDRVLGVYLILFGATVDLFVFQNPLATDPPATARLLPGHYLFEVTTAAAFGGAVPGGGDLAAGLVYLAALVGVATLSLRRIVGRPAP